MSLSGQEILKKLQERKSKAFCFCFLFYWKKNFYWTII